MQIRICAYVFILLAALAGSGLANAQENAKENTQERKAYGKHLFFENLSPSVKHDGEDLAKHMVTQNSYSVKGWTDDGKSLIFYKSGNLYKARGPRSKYIKLLDFEDVAVKRAQKAKICGKDGFVFQDDEDGDEYFAVYAATKADFQPVKLSPGRANNRALTVSNQRDMLVYASAEAGTGIWKIFSQPSCAGSEPKKLYEGRAPFYPKDFHPGDQVFLAGSALGKDYKLSEFDLASGQETELFRARGVIDDALYSADGRYIFYTTNSDRNFVEILRYDRETKDSMPVLSNLGVDVDSMIMSNDRRKITANLNSNGISKLIIFDADALSLIYGPSKKSLGIVSAAYFSPDGKKLAVALSQPTVPPRSAVYEYEKEKLKVWTGGFAAGQKLPDLMPNITSYPTFDMVDGQPRQIPLLSYLPEKASSKNPAPVVIFAHGGPASQSRPSWSKFYHYIVTKMGIAVLRPNVRGSEGYGRAFEQLDQVFKREDSVKDIGALLDWIETQPQLDSSRVVVAGGSYGGYMSLASLAMYPERFKAGIARFGVTDFHTFMENTEPYRVDNRRREYGDERDPEVAAFFKRISPLQNAHKITKPVLVIQGGQDPRVPQQQAEDMIKAIRANGTEVSYLLADNEGHGFKKSKNRRFSDGAQLAFLRQHLLED